jgi:hypothetical protein
VQRGCLHHILRVVLLVLRLWSDSRNACDDNRYTSNLLSAPLIPLLLRFQSMHPNIIHAPKYDEVSFVHSLSVLFLFQYFFSRLTTLL